MKRSNDKKIKRKPSAFADLSEAESQALYITQNYASRAAL
jgi:hypothetical protein